MRSHTQGFKNEIKRMGKQFNDKLYYTANGSTTTYTQDDINTINYSFDTSLLKSVMQELKIDTTLDLRIGNKIDYECSLEGIENSDIRFNNFNIIKKEEQKDTKSYLYTCYDNMIKAMTDYVDLNVTYPITIRSYLNAICTHLGITFANASDTFTNYNKTITSEHYLDSDGNSLGYTFRDVLDDLAEAVGGFICIDNYGELEIRYITEALDESNNSGVEYTFTTTITSGDKIVITSTNNVDTAKSLNSDISYVELSTEVAPSSNAWIFTASGTGYTIKNKQTNLYLGLSSSNTLTTSSTEYVWTWSSGNRRLSTQSTGGFTRTYYLRYSSSTGWNVSTTAGSVYLATYTGGEAETDEIDEEYFQENNVNIGKKYGPINVVTLSRNGVDNLVKPSTLPQNITEIKIENNPILDQTNREDFIDGIYNRLNGLEFYLNDFQTTGICYYEVGDLYNVSIGENTYKCLMLNDNIIRDNGLSENIYTDEPTTSVTDYKYASDTDKLEKTSRNAYFLADKANGVAEMIVEGIGDNGQVTGASVIASINDDESNLTLNADKINLNGAVTANNNFVINQDGSVQMKNANLDLTDDGTTLSTPRIKITSINEDKWGEFYSSGLHFYYDDGNDNDTFILPYQWTITKDIEQDNKGFRTDINADGIMTNVGSSGVEIQRGWYSNDEILLRYGDGVNVNQYNFWVTSDVNGSNMYLNGDGIITGDLSTNHLQVNGYTSPLVVESIKTKNLIGPWVLGSINSTNGADINDNTGFRTTYIPVDFTTNSNYCLSGTPSTSYSHFVAAYNSSKQFLGRTGGNVSSGDILTSSSFTSGTPQGTGDIAYLKVTIYNTPPEWVLDSVQLEVGNTATGFNEYQNLDGKQVYSQIETKVGYWIDGKPIYRKVITFNPSTSALQTIIPHNISNVDKILPSSQCMLNRQNGQFVPFSMTYPNSASDILVWSMGWEATKTDIYTWIGQYMRAQMDTSTYGYGAVAILEYTKTTD